MKHERNKVIESLSSELSATNRNGRVYDLIIVWLVSSFLLAYLLLSSIDPFRTGWLLQLTTHPQFFIESITGFAVIMLIAVLGFTSAIPGLSVNRKFLIASMGLFLLWCSFYIFGLWFPALEPSDAGKRELACHFETLLVGLVLLLIGFAISKRLYPLEGAKTGAILGLAAGGIPALMMQVACMYIPEHIIIHHLLPVFVVALIGAIMGKYYLGKTSR